MWAVSLVDGCPKVCLEDSPVRLAREAVRMGQVLRTRHCPACSVADTAKRVTDGQPRGIFSPTPAWAVAGPVQKGNAVPSSPTSLETVVSSGKLSTSRTVQQGLPSPPD